jgi:hypothetical protein
MVIELASINSQIGIFGDVYSADVVAVTEVFAKNSLYFP